MPKIQDYSFRSNVAGPMDTRRATAEGFGANIGRAVAGAGETVQYTGDVVYKRVEQAEVSDVNAKMAQAHSEYTNYLRETLRTADPADTTVSTKFLEKYREHVSKIGEGLSTGKGRELYSSMLAQQERHFTEAAAEGQADLAGVKAKADFTTSLNSRSSSLINDPASFDNIRGQNQEALKAYIASGGSTKVASELQVLSDRELAKSAVNGWAQTDPKYARKLLDMGKYDSYFDGDTKRQMYGHIEQAERAKEIDQERRLRLQERQLEQKRMEVQNDFINKIENRDESFSAKEILNSPLTPQQKEHYLRWTKEANDPAKAIRADAMVVERVHDLIHRPYGDPLKITDENDPRLVELVGEGKGLDFTWYNKFRKEIQDVRQNGNKGDADPRQAVFNSAKSLLTKKDPLTGNIDAVGAENYAAWLSEFTRREAEAVKAGKSPQQMYDPRSPDYLGNSIREFVKTDKQIMQGNLLKMKQGLPLSPVLEKAKQEPAKPGETPQEYLKRIRGN